MKPGGHIDAPSLGSGLFGSLTAPVLLMTCSPVDANLPGAAQATLAAGFARL